MKEPTGLDMLEIALDELECYVDDWLEAPPGSEVYTIRAQFDEAYRLLKEERLANKPCACYLNNQRLSQEAGDESRS